jgi:hypothetical protein
MPLDASNKRRHGGRRYGEKRLLAIFRSAGLHAGVFSLAPDDPTVRGENLNTPVVCITSRELVQKQWNAQVGACWRATTDAFGRPAMRGITDIHHVVYAHPALNAPIAKEFFA